MHSRKITIYVEPVKFQKKIAVETLNNVIFVTSFLQMTSTIFLKIE